MIGDSRRPRPRARDSAALAHARAIAPAPPARPSPHSVAMSPVHRASDLLERVCPRRPAPGRADRALGLRSFGWERRTAAPTPRSRSIRHMSRVAPFVLALILAVAPQTAAAEALAAI